MPRDEVGNEARGEAGSDGHSRAWDRFRGSVDQMSAHAHYAGQHRRDNTPECIGFEGATHRREVLDHPSSDPCRTEARDSLRHSRSKPHRKPVWAVDCHHPYSVEHGGDDGKSDVEGAVVHLLDRLPYSHRVFLFELIKMLSAK